MAERMFLAVSLAEDNRHAVAAHLDRLLDGGRIPGKKVPAENWHITLRFLGLSEQAEAEQVLAHLDEHLMVEPFRVRLAELGAFPKEQKASVLWMGIAGDVEPLQALAADCETAARHAGFEPEGRPFHPHLTLSRIRPPVDVRQLIDSVPPARVSVDVQEVTLYRSLLGSGPARYEIVDRVAL